MFKINEGNLDRALRVCVGLALMVWFFFDSGSGLLHYAKLIGLVLLGTGLAGSCPIYSILGLSTRRMKRT